MIQLETSILLPGGTDGRVEKKQKVAATAVGDEGVTAMQYTYADPGDFDEESDDTTLVKHYPHIFLTL
jgi:hypothetical protein